MFGQITTTDIESELRRRGIYTEAVVTPLIPEAPVTPVQVTPGLPPRYIEPVIPYVPPYIPEEVTEPGLWLPGGPPTRMPERKISKTAIIVGVGVLAAIIIFTHGEAGKPAARKKRQRTITEEFRPAETEAM